MFVCVSVCVYVYVTHLGGGVMMYAACARTRLRQRLHVCVRAAHAQCTSIFSIPLAMHDQRGLCVHICVSLISPVG